MDKLNLENEIFEATKKNLTEELKKGWFYDSNSETGIENEIFKVMSLKIKNEEELEEIREELEDKVINKIYDYMYENYNSISDGEEYYYYDKSFNFSEISELEEKFNIMGKFAIASSNINLADKDELENFLKNCSTFERETFENKYLKEKNSLKKAEENQEIKNKSEISKRQCYTNKRVKTKEENER